jgi:hypothetical protein
MFKKKKPTYRPKEINLIQFWNLDVILEYQPDYNQIVVKKPSGQVAIHIQNRDKRG